jgi:hypothetical protein
MNLIYVLHLYQPPFQFKEVLEKVYNYSYLPIFEAIKASPKAKISINITGSTLELFQKYSVGNIIQDLKDLYKSGKVEFITTSFSHTLLPYASETQLERQIELNIKTLKKLLNLEENELNILFPPEFNIDQKSIDFVKTLGIKEVFISQNSIDNFKEEKNKLSQNGINFFVRSTKVSRLLENINISSSKDFWGKIDELGLDKNGTYFALHDAEVLGFSFPHKTDFFKEILNDPQIELHTFKEESKKDNFAPYLKNIKHASWERMEINGKNINPHWKNPENKVHIFQWKLSNLVIDYVEELTKIGADTSYFQHELDTIQYSCQYWWASSYPFWSPGIVSHAAWSWLRLAHDISNIDEVKDPKFLVTAKKYYKNIMSALAQYDTSDWASGNIRYYDKYVHEKKLKCEI